jgi:hypothetical protein
MGRGSTDGQLGFSGADRVSGRVIVLGGDDQQQVPAPRLEHGAQRRGHPPRPARFTGTHHDHARMRTDRKSWGRASVSAQGLALSSIEDTAYLRSNVQLRVTIPSPRSIPR